jgi:hypothetical protein
LHSFGATTAQLPGNKNLRWTIFKIRRATGFSSIISPRRQLRQFHRPPPDSFAGIPNIVQRSGIRRPRKQFHSRFNKDRLRISGFISHGNGGIGGNPEVPPDFRRGSPPDEELS